MMSRKHYRETASILRDELVMGIEASYTAGEADQVRATVEGIAARLSTMFADDNPSFSRTTFMDACGLTHRVA